MRRKLSDSMKLSSRMMAESINTGKKRFSLMQSVRSIFSKSKRGLNK